MDSGLVDVAVLQLLAGIGCHRIQLLSSRFVESVVDGCLRDVVAVV